MAIEYDADHPGPRLARWVQAGLIDPEQADRIIAWESAQSAVTPRAAEPGLPPGTGEGPAASTTRPPAAAPAKPVLSAAVEALAYVGGAVIVAAISIVMVGYWTQMNRVTQVAIPSAATILTLLAGFAVPHRWADLGVRVRSALWLVSALGILVLMTVISDLLWEYTQPRLMLVAAPVFALAAVLWLLHRAAAQQVAAFGATCMVGMAVLDLGSDVSGRWTGLVISGIAIIWGYLAISRMLPGCGRWAPPAGSWAGHDVLAERQRRWGLGLAAVGAVFGGILLGFSRETAWIGIVSVAVVVAAGVLRSDLLVLIIGAVGTVIVLPAVTDEYLASTLTTAAVLLIVGAAMVGLALVVARRQAKRHTRMDAARPGD